MTELLYFLVFAVIFLLVGGVMAFTPYVTRRTELFGVGIPSAQTDHETCRRLRSSYCRRVLLLGLLLTVLSTAALKLLGAESLPGIFAFCAALLLFLFLSFCLYLAAHRRAGALKAEMGWEADRLSARVLADTEAPGKDTLSPAWLLLFPLVILLTVMGIAIAWPYAPEEIPLQIGLDGTVSRTVPKGPGAAAPMIAGQIILTITFTGVFFVLRGAKRQIDAADPEASRRRDRRFRRILSGGLIVGGVLLLAFLGLLQIGLLIRPESRFIMGLSLGMTALLGLALFLLMFRVGQGGSRLGDPKGPAPLGVDNRNEDRRWKWGIFYCNPADPALFVEKRFGIGYTFNLGRPLGWLIVAGFLLILTGISLWINMAR